MFILHSANIFICYSAFKNLRTSTEIHIIFPLLLCKTTNNTFIALPMQPANNLKFCTLVKHPHDFLFLSFSS
jgi:hypothetical protein